MDKKPGIDASETLGHFVRWFFNVSPTAMIDGRERGRRPSQEAANDSRQPEPEQALAGERPARFGHRS